MILQYKTIPYKAWLCEKHKCYVGIESKCPFCLEEENNEKRREEIKEMYANIDGKSKEEINREKRRLAYKKWFDKKSEKERQEFLEKKRAWQREYKRKNKKSKK